MEKQYNVLLADSFLLDMLPLPAKVCEVVLERLETLVVFPEIGAISDLPRWKGYRQLIVGEYRVLYTVYTNNHLVTVYFLRHGRMDVS